MTLAQAITKGVDFFYVKPLRSIIPLVTFRYVVCGGLNMLLGWLVYAIIYKHIIGVEFINFGLFVMSRHILTYFIQFVFTFLAGFWLNRYVTFSLSEFSGRKQFFRYILQNAGSLLLGYLIMKILVEGLSVYALVARPVTDAIVVVYSYLTARFFTFRFSRKQKP